MIAEELQNISEEDLAILAEELHVQHTPHDSECKGKAILAMILEWESVQAKLPRESCTREAGSKKEFARVLYNDVSSKINESAELFKKVARAIDMTG